MASPELAELPAWARREKPVPSANAATPAAVEVNNFRLEILFIKRFLLKFGLSVWEGELLGLPGHGKRSASKENADTLLQCLAEKPPRSLGQYRNLLADLEKTKCQETATPISLSLTIVIVVDGIKMHAIQNIFA